MCIDNLSHRQLRSRAKHSAYGEFRYQLPLEVEFAVNAIYSIGLYNLDGDGIHVRLPRYTVAHAKLSKQITPTLKAYVSVSNFGDEDYQHHLGYPRPGRWARMGVALNL